MSRLVVAIGHVEFTRGSQVVYVVKVQQDVDEWEVRRTYSDFRKLRDDVQHVMKDGQTHILDDSCSQDFLHELQSVKFPSKRLFGSKKDHVVKERAEELHRFLIKLLLLTHTYRKAQKVRYDQYTQVLPEHQQTAFAASLNRTQASVMVFYLLRDFLKPKIDVPSSRLGNNSGKMDEESGNGSSRLIRESKVLAMRNSNTSKCNNLSFRQDEKMPQHIKEPQQEQQNNHQEQQQSISEHMNPPATNPANDKFDLTLRNDRSNRRNTSQTMETPERSRTDASSIREQKLQKHHNNSDLANEERNHRYYSTPDGNTADWKHRSACKSTSMSTLNDVGSSLRDDDSEPEKEEMSTSSSVPPSASSATSADEAKLLDLSSLSQYKRKKSSRRSSLSSREKKSSSRTKKSAQSAKNIPMSDSERMSRVSSALNAQAVSIDAQRELERYMSEYCAIMILRYVDRFVNKAVMKGPGCYHVNAQEWLVIDGKRFLKELELTFTDLPNNFGDLFHIGAPGDHDEWGLPLALNKYVQLKWESFQAMHNNSISHDYEKSIAADLTSDSDDSDTDYDYEEVGGGGYMTAKQTFSNDEESMLQEMIANGTAGREQMLRLRRQMNEQGWNRRENPGSRSQRLIEEISDTDKEETIAQQREKRSSKRCDSKKVSRDVENYQQEQNARRKDRLSRVQSIGGFV